MSRYALAHLDDHVLLRDLAVHVTRNCAATADLLARRFGNPDVPTRVAPVMASAPSPLSNSEVSASEHQLAPGPVEAPRPRVTPLAPERFSVQFTVGQDTFETLRYVQALLGHQVPSGDVAQVFDRALRALKTELEKTRFAATARPRVGRQRTSDNPRYVPTHVKRAVWLRDGGQCGFVSESGTRCPERSRLEFDHIVEVARGGEATIDGIRLRCRAHNQYEAERTFGAGFMQLKRDEARRAAAERRTGVSQPQPAPEPVCVASVHHETDRDLLHCLKELGWRADAARLAMEHSGTRPEASIGERLHAALKFLGARGRTYGLRQAVMNRPGSAGFAPSRLAAP